MSEGGGKKTREKPHYKYPSHARKRSARSRTACLVKKKADIGGYEQSDGSQAFEEGAESWAQNTPRQQAAARNVVTPLEGQFPMHNEADVRFEAPRVPVIFVLGGPGSGKVTHCDNLMQEKKGVVHINMSDLLQQYAVGNDMPDYGQLSSKTVTEVLMLEMKMAPSAKTFLVSGYPRNMRDVVEYSEKIQVVNGVILISWRQKILERQIDYGAKLGQVILSLARMELNNFYKNVVPVAEYFDQSNMLIPIHGERPPAEVYQDFRSAVFRILGNQENPPEFGNGRTAPVPDDTSSELPRVPGAANTAEKPRAAPSPERPRTQVISVGAVSAALPPSYGSPPPKPAPQRPPPPVLWVIGGPGSNKAALCAAAAKRTGWTHISLGKLLRAAAEPPDPRYNNEVVKLRECISNGELVPLEIIMKYVESHMADNTEAEGIILDGFPRDMPQVTEFENKFTQKPTIILLDCSKLQLGKGRLDDSVTAFRRRLEIFRQSSLPMLKAMDNIGRLTIVDGDTDTTAVREDFMEVVREHIDYMNSKRQPPTAQVAAPPNGHLPNGNAVPAELHDLEAPAITTVSRQVANGHLANGVVANGFAANGNGHANYNGYAAQGEYVEGHM